MSYSWGDDTGSSGTYGGSGYDYGSARRAYGSGARAKAASSTSSGYVPSRASAYRSGAAAAKHTPPPVGKDVETDSKHPIVVATDVTGSMSSWPRVIFEKLPLLGEEVHRYAKDYKISFCAFGDVHYDDYPLQVRDFDDGENLDKHIEELYPEAGGGDAPESHDAVAYYYINHCKIDEAVKPIFLLITDVDSHMKLTSSAIKKYTGDDIRQDLDSRDLLEKLGEKFSVYVLLKDTIARGYWEDIYGAQRVKEISEPRDVVELAIGIIAAELGAIKDFEMRSSKRHSDKPDRVSRVMKSVRSGMTDVDADEEDAGKASTKSKSDSSMKSKKLV
jgi:sulfur transfer complex TusBCD TusB component (DsrH family)